MDVSEFKINLRVVRNRFLILEDKEHSWDSEVTPDVQSALEEGRIILPEVGTHWAKKTPDTGTVIDHGPEVKTPLRPGTRVRFGKFAGQKFEHEGHKLQIVNELDILGIEEPNPRLKVTITHA